LKERDIRRSAVEARPQDLRPSRAGLALRRRRPQALAGHRSAPDRPSGQSGAESSNY